MLNRTRRVNKETFEELLKRGKSAFSSSLSVKYINKGEGKSIFGFVISGKVAKKATDRNLFKRRCRHIVKKNLTLIKEGFIVAIFAKQGIIKFSFAELESEIVILLKKSGILKN